MSKEFVEQCESLSKYDALEKMRNADLSLILNCLKDPETPDRFLSRVFYHRPDLTEEGYQLIGRHEHTPRQILGLVQVIKPEWLKNSPAMSLVQLSFMEAEQKAKWDHSVEKIQKRSFYHMLDDLYSSDYKILGPHYGGYSYWGENEPLMREIMRRCPNFIIKHYISTGSIDDVEYIAQLASDDILSTVIKHKNFRVRKHVAEQPKLTDDLYFKLAQDRTASVRKAVASNESSPHQAMVILAKDKDNKVVDALLKNKNLQSSLKQEIIDSRQSTVTKDSGDNEDLSTTLNLLRTYPLNEETLLKLAEHPTPLIRAATGYHPSANENIFDTLMKEEQSWIKGGVALHSSNTKHLRALAQLNDFDTNFGLASNPATPQEDILILLENCKDDIIRLRVANTFFENETIIGKITSKSLSKSDWEKQFAIALDPKTKGNKLLHIHRSREWRHMAISKAIARNPSCPKSLHSTYGFYIPQELSKNPAFLLQALENLSLPKEEYLDWKIDQQMMDRCAHEFINNYYIKQESHVRQGVSGRFLDMNQVLHLALCEDAHTAQRFVSNRPSRFIRYIYEALAFHPSASTRKQLASNQYAPDNVILALAKDKDKAVQMAASKTAKSIKLSVNVKIDKTSLKSLGNKQARLDLAKSSNDLEILDMLAKDKIRDVRDAIANRENIRDESLLLLAQDSDEAVARNAFTTSLKRELSKEKSDQLDTAAIHYIRDNNISPRMRCIAVRAIRDLTLLKQVFPSDHGDIDKAVLKRCDDADIIKQAIFMDQQNGKPDLAYSVMENPHLTIEQFDKVSLIFTKLETQIDRLRSPEVYIEALKRGLSPKRLRYAYPEFTAEHVMEVLNLSMDYVELVHNHLHKLSHEQTMTLLKSDANYRVQLANNYNTSNELRELLFKDYGHELKVIRGLSYYCELPPEQIDSLINHEDEEVRGNLAYNQTLNNEQALKLAKDHSRRVKNELVSRYYHEKELDNEPLLILAEDSDKDIAREARDTLKERGIKVEKKPSALTVTDVLKTYNAPFGAAKANKKLLAMGILEEAQRESTSKPGEFKTFKRLSKKGEEYGVNKYNQYGDATAHYYPNKFEELLKLMLEKEAEPA